MSKIQELIDELCPDGVPHLAMGEIGNFTRGSGIQKKDFLEEGFPAIHYGQVFTQYGLWAEETFVYVSEAIARKSRLAEPGDVVIATTSENNEDLAKSVAWVGTYPIAVSSDAMIYSSTVLDAKYISYFLDSIDFQIQKEKYITGTKVKRISSQNFSKIRIPVPPMKVQEEIVRILDSFTLLEAELEAELEARRKQYAHYRDSLLNFEQMGGQTLEFSTFESCFNLKAGKHISASKIFEDSDNRFPCFGGNGIRGFCSEYSHDGDYLIIGRQGALCGNVQRIKGKFYATEHAVVVSMKQNIDISWAYHYLTQMNLRQYASKSAQPGLNVSKLKKLPILDINKFEQNKIGAILDKFDALVNDINSGLPAEIEARRKQYEYYRDRLLTFKELESQTVENL